MVKNGNEEGKNKGFSLLLPILLVFFVLAAVVFSVSSKLTREMSASAIQNLSESLDLLRCTIETILNKEAEFQQLVAQEIAELRDPEEYIRSYQRNQTMVKMSLIRVGKTEGVSSTGEVFTEEELNFAAGGMVNGLHVSQSYLNYMGAWAYTIKCPVEKDGQVLGSLYIEYIYDSLDDALPEGFYNGNALLYIMDAESERMVLKPKGMGERNAGHLNLEDFYRANEIWEQDIRGEVSSCLETGSNIMFYHDIQGKDSLNFMWSVNGGTIFLVGYVPVEAIQQEGKTVNQNILIVVAVMLIAFFVCCALFFVNLRQQNKIRKEQEAEREMHSQQLAEALQAAQAASNSKTTFLSNMSHDIRTPMNAVLGFTTLLARDADNPEKVRDYTKKIMASGQHLLSLINDILDVSKIESGKVVLNLNKFTLSDLVVSVDAIVRPMAQAKNQNFHVEVMGIRHEYLMGDMMRINQILLNLLSNAVKYTQEGGDIWFRIIGLKQRSNQYEHIRIEVEDNGYGMTEEYLKTIFDAFTRAENSTTNKVQGTGLGMAITKNIVELMGGTIEVFSEVDQGSLFRVDLEFRMPEEQIDRQFWRESGIKQILAVDDDVNTCEGIRSLMKETGIRVDIVSDGEEALSLFEEQNSEQEEYHLIILDYVLKNSLQTARQLREAVDDTVPILLLTDVVTDEMEELSCMENMGILQKPFFVSSLKEKILELKEEQKEEKRSMEEADMLVGLHFLAAEDNEINAEILAEILEMEGATCEIVENGQLAVKRFQDSEAGEFDAILMDVQMPVMNGYEASRAIRALEREDANLVPIIAMTANAFAEDEKEALEAGMDVHVAKPIDMELLKKAIKQCVQKNA
ncbi:MAG: response regulator [Lachnospiraceae bacterium]|nr:response regulator [Lachnospiraceae bacterium]